MAQDKFQEVGTTFEHGKEMTPARKSKATVKLKKIGNSLGVTLPKKLLDAEGFATGDEFFVIKTQDGLLLTQSDPEFVRRMEMVRQIMKEDDAVLRELAK